MATIKIVHASISENGTINGRPGDQTGGEVCERDFYERGWKWVLRPNTALLAADLVTQARMAADNDNIGYGQADRLTLYHYIADYAIVYLSDVDEPVNCDCSSLIAVLCNLAGVNVPPDMWTGNEVDMLVRTKNFASYRYEDGFRLLAGDILLAVGHTAIVTSVSGSPVADFADQFDPDYAGIYLPDTLVNIRTGAGTDKPIITEAGRSDRLRNYGYFSLDWRGVVWYLVMLPDNRIGWVSSRVVTKEDSGKDE